MLAALALLSALAIAPYIPRTVVSARAAPELFSAERAAADLEVIAQQSHPLGSAENAIVRAYLLQQLSSLGLQPEIQRATVFNPSSGGAAIVHNVLVRLPGTVAGSGAVLVTAHYDSVQSGPGAGDDGMAVASMLETIRAIRAGQPLRKDVIFLFNDGEEPGLYGSMAFVQQHPWAHDVGVVFDFDADGARGPSTLLWTTPGDSWLISELGRAGSGIVAQPSDSLAFRSKRNNDLHVFAAGGFSGAHFDVIGGQTYYHTPRDNVASLDLASMQSQGDLMLTVVRHFGNLTTGGSSTEDGTLATPFGSPLVWYPSAWTLPLALLTAVAMMGVAAYGLRRGLLSPLRLAVALGGVFASALVAAAVGHVVWQVVLASHPESQYFGEADFYGQSWYVSGLCAIVLALGFVLWPRLAGALGEANLALAGGLATAAVALTIAVVQPWLAYLEIWPVLAAAGGLAYLLAGGFSTSRIWLRLVVLLLVAVPAAALSVSGLYLSILSGVQGSPALILAVLVFLFGLLTPQVLLASSVARRWLPVVVGAVGIGLFGVGVTVSGYSAAQPKPDTAAYLLNADTGQAVLATADQRLDGYTGQLLTDPHPRTLDELIGAGGSSTLVSSAAPSLPLVGPTLIAGARQVDGEVQTLALHLASPRGAWRAFVFPGPAVELLAAGFGDAPPATLQSKSLTVVGLPPEGLDFTLRLRARGPLELVVVDQTIGLPELVGVPTRPVAFMTAPAPDDLRGYPTFVAAKVTLP